jgi:hypothetical protein
MATPSSRSVAWRCSLATSGLMSEMSAAFLGQSPRGKAVLVRRVRTG